MNSRTLIIREVSRLPKQDPEDTLVFTQGVNVIAGVPNTGKTKWLQMIDYLLGDKDTPEESFGDDLVQKFDLVKGVIVVAGQEVTIERRWKEPGVRTKVFINDEPLSVKDWWDELMNKLEIPIVHYPQGNPYGPRAWPELNWRSLYRHMYRRQKFWSDIADKQPEVEQHACIMQFLGLASRLFSPEYKDLISNEKRIEQLQIAKDQYVSTLEKVSKELVGGEDLGVALTPQSIEAAIQRFKSEIEAQQEERKKAISTLINQATEKQEATEPAMTRGSVEKLGEDLASLNVEHEEIIAGIRKTESRLREVEEYRKLIKGEYSRMERAVQAGSVLADLQITHCPACDREIDVYGHEHICHLCKRPVDSTNGSTNRLEFELEQLRSEVSEAEELVERLETDVRRLADAREEIVSKISRIQNLLRPTRVAITSILPPELAINDQEIGRLEERVNQLERLKKALGYREHLSDQIAEIQQTLAALESEALKQSNEIDFERAGDLLADGMNTYLNEINRRTPNSWTQDRVKVRLGERKFSFKVGDSNWQSKLGGTLTLYFLIAYHYALMTLTPHPECNFPGLILLNFPAQLEDATSIKDKENFVLEPFIDMLRQSNMQNTQLIAVGSSFEALEGANRIEFNRVWK